MILNDTLIKQHKGMIEPFHETMVSEGVISYGLSSAGYDFRLSGEFYLFDQGEGVIDPKNFDCNSGHFITANELIVPPHAFFLASSVEYVTMPDDVFGLCMGKSTYARCGLVDLTTPIEPGWQGNITFEFFNSTPRPIKVYAREGGIQVVFFKCMSKPETSYADRGGKYQGQTGITLPKVKK